MPSSKRRSYIARLYQVIQNRRVMCGEVRFESDQVGESLRCYADYLLVERFPAYCCPSSVSDDARVLSPGIFFEVRRSRKPAVLSV